MAQENLIFILHWAKETIVEITHQSQSRNIYLGGFLQCSDTAKSHLSGNLKEDINHKTFALVNIKKTALQDRVIRNES